MYKPGQIVNRYRMKEFKEIPKGKLWRFVGPIINRKDQGTLQTWMDHFKSVKVPFVVIKETITNRQGRKVVAKYLVCEQKV